MRWLAIHCPLLALESLAPERTERPLAICETLAGRQRILLCNRSAAAVGVIAGMTAGAVRALSSQVQLLPREPGRERAALEALAQWSGRFSPQVSLSPPWGLLLEVAGSLRLFGGLDALLAQLRADLAALRYSTNLCLAETPEGAALLARQGCDCVLHDLHELRRALQAVPLEALPLSGGEREALQGMGLARLEDLLRLPRSGLGRRLGGEFVRYLQRLLGELPDPRPLFLPPDRFDRSLQLPAEVSATRSLLFAIRRLLLELDGFLRRRQLGTRELRWSFHHGAGNRSFLRLGLARPERDSGRLQLLLRERLERFVLPAPVQEIALRVTHLEPLAGRPLDLFGTRADHAGTPLLVDRLRARLGEAAVSAIEMVAEHRPERAWRRTCATAMVAGGGGGEMPRLQLAGQRPLWLLPQAEPLAERAGWPWWRGRLQLEGERERIESGWWDDDAIARDYFVAIAPAGERLWIYREIDAHRRWYLHGFF